MEAIAWNLEFVSRPTREPTRRFGRRDGQVSRLQVTPSVLSPADVYHAVVMSRAQNRERTREKLLQRGRDLLKVGPEDGIKIQEASWRDFVEMVNTTDFASMPALVLLENGNFRAVWRGDGSTQAGLQFLGDGAIQYALITGDRYEYAAGRVRASNVKAQLKAHRLDTLVFA